MRSEGRIAGAKRQLELNLNTFLSLHSQPSCSSLRSSQTGLSRFVRFNIQQAILIDIALIFPSLFGSAADALPRYLVEPATNFVFYAFATSIVYCFVSNLVLGKEPNEIPVVSSAANEQLGPF